MDNADDDEDGERDDAMDVQQRRESPGKVANGVA